MPRQCMQAFKKIDAFNLDNDFLTSFRGENDSFVQNK